MERRAEILIVDDNPINLQVLSGILEQENYKVRAALSGEIALRAVEGGVPDLVLLDINMPGMSGLEMLPKVKAERPNVPVIMITAYGDDATKRKAAELGAAGLIAKPIDFGVLRAEIDQRLDGTA